ncbi:hypothetical protein RHSIM_Rhsim02G0049000 [Rhododendron simsii]|uniref:Pentatricopeptide repeat-containing protein n=1 Tax=Rhododendron simsii TaxID=118357 RepID=A0A834HNB6_RHOSS|nr:hypothetical protein RHSIM_Rhsim02G0049000 [Rhododendron simsii]
MRTRRIAGVALIFSPTTTARNNYRKGNPFLHHHALLFHATHFTTNPNRTDFISITNRQQLQKLLSEKSKTGFDKLDHALSLFRQMARFRPLPSVVHFTQLLTAVAKMKEYLSVISLCSCPSVGSMIMVLSLVSRILFKDELPTSSKDHYSHFLLKPSEGILNTVRRKHFLLKSEANLQGDGLDATGSHKKGLPKSSEMS